MTTRSEQRRAAHGPRAVILALAVLAPGEFAQAAGIDAERAALLLLRTLTFDQSLAERTRGRVDVAIVGESPDCTVMRGMLDQVVSRGIKVSGLPLRVIAIPELGPSGSGLLEELRPAALFLCGNATTRPEAIAKVTRALKILSFTQSASDLEAGLSVAFITEAGKPRLVVNLEAARAEGARLSSELLALARITGS